jgi:hypothetical protein
VGAGLFDLTEAREREDLEAAAVGEDGAVPVHEVVDATQALDAPVAGSQKEVIGVDQEDVGTRVPDLFGHEGLHGGERADGHEGGRADGAVAGGNQAGSRGDG